MEKLQEFMDKHNILERQQTAAENCSKAKRVMMDLERELEDIDRLLLEGKLEAECQCGKLNMHPWSLKLRNQHRVQWYWELWKHQLKTGRDYSDARSRLEAKIKKTDPVKPTKQEVHQLIRKARKQVKEIQQEAKETREQFLKE